METARKEAGSWKQLERMLANGVWKGVVKNAGKGGLKEDWLRGLEGGLNGARKKGLKRGWGS